MSRGQHGSQPPGREQTEQERQRRAAELPKLAQGITEQRPEFVQHPVFVDSRVSWRRFRRGVQPTTKGGVSPEGVSSPTFQIRQLRQFAGRILLEVREVRLACLRLVYVWRLVCSNSRWTSLV